jgi:hypothetical protein
MELKNKRGEYSTGVFVTPVGEIQFVPNLSAPNENGKYSVCVSFGTDDELVKPLVEVVQELIKAKWGKKPTGFKCSLKKIKAEEGEEPTQLEGQWKLNVSSKFAPVVKNAKNQPVGAEYATPHSQVRLAVVASTFINSDGISKGITFYLQGVQVIKQGDTFGGDYDFETVDVPEEPKAASYLDSFDDGMPF